MSEIDAKKEETKGETAEEPVPAKKEEVPEEGDDSKAPGLQIDSEEIGKCPISRRTNDEYLVTTTDLYDYTLVLQF